MTLVALLKNKKSCLFILMVLPAMMAVIFLFQKSQTEEMSEDLAVFSESPPIEIFSLASVISRVDGEKKLIFVQHPTEDKEIKVLVDDGVEIIKLEFPFDPKNPPSQASFAPKYTKIALQDLKPGNHALIETSENIYNKYEFDDVKSIQVLP